MSIIISLVPGIERFYYCDARRHLDVSGGKCVGQGCRPRNDLCAISTGPAGGPVRRKAADSMATATIDGIQTRYEVTGSGPPLLMYSPGGFDATVEKWSTQGVYAKIRLLEH